MGAKHIPQAFMPAFVNKVGVQFPQCRQIPVRVILDVIFPMIINSMDPVIRDHPPFPVFYSGYFGSEYAVPFMLSFICAVQSEYLYRFGERAEYPHSR